MVRKIGVASGLFSALVVVGSGQSGSTTLDYPESIGPAQCVVRTGAATTAIPRGTKIECSPGATISCNFRTAEPIDVVASELCSRPMAIVPAKPVQLHYREGPEIAVEWLEIPSDGHPFIIASRILDSGSTASINVAPLAKRMLRFRRAGSAATTARALDVAADDRWRVPDVGPGSAELIVLLEPAAIMPTAVGVVGVRVPESAREGIAILRLATPGRYRLVSHFEGGAVTRSAEVEVRRHDSAFLRLSASDVGGVTIAADPVLCQNSDRIGVFERTSQFGTREVHGLDHGGTCNQTVSGLRPGTYEISLLRGGRDLVTRPVKVERQLLSPLFLTFSSTMVMGRVTLPGSDLSGAFIRFDPVSGGTTTTGVLDNNGLFLTDVNRPGEHSATVTLRNIPFLGQQRVVDLRLGLNTFDWDIDGGTLSLNITGWDRVSRLDIVLKQSGRTRPGPYSTTFSPSPKDENPYNLNGLAPGAYEIRASTESGIAPRQKVTVSRGSASAVTLNLQPNRSILRVLNGSGGLVTGARVPGGKETSPGVFALLAAEPGSDLLVTAPGYAPACRTAPSSGSHDLVMVSSRATALHFPVDGLADPPGAIRWSSSQCFVQLTVLRSAVMIGAAAGGTTFRFLDFPSVDSFAFSAQSGTEVNVPVVNGMAFIPYGRR